MKKLQLLSLTSILLFLIAGCGKTSEISDVDLYTNAVTNFTPSGIIQSKRSVVIDNEEPIITDTSVEVDDKENFAMTTTTGEDETTLYLKDDKIYFQGILGNYKYVSSDLKWFENLTNKSNKFFKDNIDESKLSGEDQSISTLAGDADVRTITYTLNWDDIQEMEIGSNISEDKVILKKLIELYGKLITDLTIVSKTSINEKNEIILVDDTITMKMEVLDEEVNIKTESSTDYSQNDPVEIDFPAELENATKSNIGNINK